MEHTNIVLYMYISKIIYKVIPKKHWRFTLSPHIPAISMTPCAGLYLDLVLEESLLLLQLSLHAVGSGLGLSQTLLQILNKHDTKKKHNVSDHCNKMNLVMRLNYTC